MISQILITDGSDEATYKYQRKIMTRVNSKNKLKVMSFNVKVGSSEDGADHWRYRRRIFMNLLRLHPHDLICTQEALPFQIEAIEAEFPEFNHLGIGRYHGVEVDRAQESGHGEHCAIFYDTTQFEILEHETFWLSCTPEIAGSMSWGNDLARIVTWAQLIFKTNRVNFFIFNTHLHWGEHFQRQAALLLHENIRIKAEGKPVILTGDFNCLPDSEPWKILTSNIEYSKDGKDKLSDCWRSMNKSDEYGGTSHSFTGKPENRIDWILTSQEFKVKAVERLEYNHDGRYPSDHFPISATLEFSGD